MNPSQPDPAADGLRRIAVQQLQANQLGAAQATLETLVGQVPGDVAACLELSRIMAERGQWRASSHPLLQAMQHLPRHAPALLKLAQQLIGRGEIVAARQCLDFINTAPDPPIHLLLAQAHLRFTLGEILPARTLVERALNAGADDPDDYYLHAMLLQFSGDLEGACRVLVNCLRRWPTYGDAAVVLANLHKHAGDVDVLALIDSQLQRPLPPQASTDRKFVRADFEYARFRLLDDAGKHDDAWPALAHCNALMHELNPYDAQTTQATTDALIEFSPLGSRPAARQEGGPMPIFIVGMPRSGTTLLERILSSHSQVTSAGELFDFWRQLHGVANVRPHGPGTLGTAAARSREIDFAELGARYLAQTQWRAHGRRFYVDKLPSNIELVAFIRQALPRAPIVHIHRDAMDVCYSNFKALFGNAAAYSYDQSALAHFYAQYLRVVRHWRTHLPDAMLDVPYADLVEDTETTVRAILAYCGLDMEAACLNPERNRAPAATPSNAQVREPVHRHGNDRWRAYANQLLPLRRALADVTGSAVDAPH